MTGNDTFNFFCSWSGGKDSCLALYRMIRAGSHCAALFTMIDETGEHSRAHSLTVPILQAQAAAMGLPLRVAYATWEHYENEFRKVAKQFGDEGVLDSVFGDIDLDEHRQWVERVCSESGITAHEPLWRESRRGLVDAFVNAGFTACIVVVNTKKMPARFLGRIIDAALADELESLGIDACGENGEYHSFVYDGPLFRQKVHFSRGTIVRVLDYVFLPVTVTEKNT